MQAHSIPFTKATVDRLAIAYKSPLEASLELKPGAISLLRYLKCIGKRIAVLTEGSKDAQQWTLEKLGIKDHVDELITTNRIGRANVDGLFGLVLEHLKLDAQEMVYLGDNWERDVVPARAEGILAIHYSEAKSVSLDVMDLRINTLQKLENILRI